MPSFPRWLPAGACLLREYFFQRKHRLAVAVGVKIKMSDPIYEEEEWSSFE